MRIFETDHQYCNILPIAIQLLYRITILQSINIFHVILDVQLKYPKNS